MKIENVWYELDWVKFTRGYSFFVPCIDTDAALAVINAKARRFKIILATKVVVEDGVKGLRVWRV